MYPDNKTNYYLVRTIQELVEKNIIGIGWVNYHFNEIKSATEVINLVNKDHGIGRRGNQIRRFYEVKENDIIVAPLPHCIAIGRAAGGLLYDEAYYSHDRANQRKVNFLKDNTGTLATIPRSSFSEAFQRRLRVKGMTVNDMGEFADEIREAILSIENGKNHSWINQLDAETENHRDIFKKRLLKNIQSGKTNLITGGTGLENLVKELLEIEGYKACVLSKQHFGSYADADVKATRSDRCSLIKLLVQVKHHQGYTNEHGIRQLQEIQNAHSGEYDDYQRVLVTSASVSSEIIKVADDSNIMILDGEDLVDWISEHIAKLSEKTKKSLSIYASAST